MQIVLFAKWPEAGKVKTRLSPIFDAEKCADFAELLIQCTMNKIALSKFTDRKLAIWPPYCVERARNKFQISTIPQSAGDLGDKMADVIQLGINAGSPCVILGCDVPHIEVGILNQAYDYLDSGNDVIGPTNDGGFYLIGLHRFDPVVFENIVWGGNQVFNQVMRNYFSVFNDRIYTLPLVRDLDEPDDVREVATTFEPIACFLKSLETGDLRNSSND